MTITPDQARELLDGAVPGPWDASFDDEADATRLYPWGEDEEIEDSESWELARNAPDLAQTIAWMTEEWGVEVDGNALFPVREEEHPMGAYFTPDRAEAEAVRDRMAKLNQHNRYRLVRRLVGPVEVAE